MTFVTPLAVSLSLGNVLILIGVVIDIVVTGYLLVSYLQHRRITRAEVE